MVPTTSVDAASGTPFDSLICEWYQKHVSNSTNFGTAGAFNGFGH